MIKLILSLTGLIILGYLMGNISNARIISRIINKDITKLGSGNPGTMNMTRNFGAKLGLLTLVLDIIKSVIPCLIAFLVAKYIVLDYINILIYATGLSVVIGHIFPVIYKFKGGKGVASTIGIFLVVYPIYTIIALILGLVVLLIFKIGSLTSFCVIISLSVVGIVFANNFVEIILVVLLLVIILLTHIQNIKKLLTGKENKVELFKNKNHTNLDHQINKQDEIKEEEQAKVEDNKIEDNKNIDNKIN